MSLEAVAAFGCGRCRLGLAFTERRALRDHLIAQHGLDRARAIVESWRLLGPEEQPPVAARRPRRPPTGPRRQRRCSICRVPGHKAPTCPQRRR